ncbi:TPA: hypothetical protein NI581_005469 [Pseudomonas aeruginosa]|uniref:hypothetical protein n=1 Tax=Pseudomonas aeruginosa TaxID=287 RepID=UPI00155B0BCE|nr:hypothetical protein [Pseudomonas aeruginosa]EJY6040560.1 hypothetical protein [Pseudomonas aeruginosa]EKW2826980.1 hypothetical protein [Pseudomonas aeruginosa]MBG5800382.1 hypothetical protein [Pseudomonas aeruginosa]MBH4267106.1 hypothetical protein [Pseudomonas aeruginosa]MBP8322066.1 hypothetical protein [Pseudomonas aeruginosa]
MTNQTVDVSLLQIQYASLERELESLKQKSGLPPGGDGVDTRIINLERDMTDVKVAIGKVETRLENIERNMVTKGQLAVYALLGLMTMVGAGWWVVQQYLAPILAAIGKIPA